MKVNVINCLGRSISIREISKDFETGGLPFAVLIPALRKNEIPSIELLAEDLAGRGCKEICLVGPCAEQAHDIADKVLEESGFTDVVTTWHVEYEDACEYFLFAAMAGKGSLVAMIASHEDIIAELVKVARAL